MGAEGVYHRLRPRVLRDPRDVRAPVGAVDGDRARGVAGLEPAGGAASRHETLLAEIDARYQDFSDLDSRFHRLINAAAPNRFIDGFYDVITLIFHYHYQWNKRDERQRNEAAIREHLTYIDALLDRESVIIERACRAHLFVGPGDTDPIDGGTARAVWGSLSRSATSSDAA